MFSISIKNLAPGKYVVKKLCLNGVYYDQEIGPSDCDIDIFIGVKSWMRISKWTEETVTALDQLKQEVTAMKWDSVNSFFFYSYFRVNSDDSLCITRIEYLEKELQMCLNL